jgi:hypothetical protein
MHNYNLSFTFGGLLLPESTEIAHAYVQSEDWEAVRQQVMNENILQKTRLESRKRYFRGLLQRFKAAYRWELECIAGSELEAKRAVLFLIMCRNYEFIRDFYIEVVRRKLLLNDFSLHDYEYYAFFEQKLEEHPELNELSDSSTQKVRAIVLKVHREVGILEKDKAKTQLSFPLVPQEVQELYKEHGMEDEVKILQFKI